MYDLLQRYINSRIKIEATFFEESVAPFFKPLQVKRNEFLLHKGDICKHFYFVNKGCIRLFDISEKGEEGTRYFAFEESFGTALSSLISGEPAFEFIQAVEKSELLAINKESFYLLVEKTPHFSLIYKKILENAYITAQKRIYGFQTLDAVDKFRWLLTYQPNILTRLSNKIVASYLGITPETLSRLKNKLYPNS